MALADTVKIYKAALNTNTGANGGRMSRAEVLDRAKHNIFPMVTAAQRLAGVTSLRKIFWTPQDPDNGAAANLLVYLEAPSLAGDAFFLGRGTQTDTQAGLSAGLAFCGVGQLHAPLAGGEAAVSLSMESNLATFAPGSFLRLSNWFKAGQSAAANVRAGDSIQYSAGQWSKIAPDASVVYPKGRWLGGGLVLTNDAAAEEFLHVADPANSGEVMGTGDGSDLTPTLAGLVHAASGVCGLDGFGPVIHALCGGVSRTVTVGPSGACAGYCTAGALNMATGAWTTPLAFTSPPDDATDITVDYRENPYSYAGNVATVQLAGQVAGAYEAANTFGAGCLGFDLVETSLSDWSETSAAGTFDESGHPPDLENKGTEEEDWTITFTSATAFTCAGLRAGLVGAGVVTSDFAPINPATGVAYFTLPAAGWAGTWAGGDRVQFKTHPPTAPVWIKETVPASCAAEPDNMFCIGWYFE